MTGFGAAEVAGPRGRFRAELRSVNGRFLEVRLRVPPMMAASEGEFRKRIAAVFSRGRLDLSLSWEPSELEAPPIRVNTALARAYLEAANRLGQELGLLGEVTLVQVLGLPGVVESLRLEEAPKELLDLAMETLGAAIERVDSGRRAEGDATAADLMAHLERLACLRGEVVSRAETVPAEAKTRLEERLARLGTDSAADPARLAQEVAYLADRSDISEELSRLLAHLERARGTLEGSDLSLGKGLEFLAQEMLRETNTIGSKSSDAAISGQVLEMKGIIEKIREQAQNLE